MHGNIATTIFTIDFRRAAQHDGWLLQRDFNPGLTPWDRSDLRRHTALDVQRAIAAAGMKGTVIDISSPHVAATVGFGGAERGYDSLPAGRAGLSQQLATFGSRGMHTDRMALIASVQEVSTRH